MDLEARDMPNVVSRCVEEFCIEGWIEEDQKSDVLRVLLYRHKYVSDSQFKRRNMSLSASIATHLVTSLRSSNITLLITKRILLNLTNFLSNNHHR